VLTRGQSGEIYNIGGGRELTNLELAKLILKEMGRDESLISFVTDRPGHDFRYSVDIRKITSELGYQPMVRFEEGIAETINWYVQNEKWWSLLKRDL
jgi:dTDP-glucose 4,6-dehydratase